MNFFYKAYRGAVISVFSVFMTQAVYTPLPVPVILTHYRCDARSPLILMSEQGFDVVAIDGKKIKHYDIPDRILRIRSIKHDIVINDIATKSNNLIITPRDGVTTFASRQYVGMLGISSTKKVVTLKHYVDDGQLAHYKETAVANGMTEKQSFKKSDVKKAQAVAMAAHRHPYNVRVLLDTRDYQNSAPWNIICAGGCVVVDPDDTAQPVQRYGPNVSIYDREGDICINGRRYTQRKLYLVPVEGAILFDNRPYLGAFFVTRHNYKTLLINSLDIEDYIYGVLKSESWPGWPLEVNKAFAIASRSYVIAMVFRARATKIPYHIKNTNAHQTYNGHHDSPKLRQAVEQTKGMFLSYNKEPIIAMFDICCGGVVPSKIHDFNFAKAPYLARTYPCTYCKGCCNYDWRATYSLDDIVRICKPHFPLIKNLKSVKITTKDKAGLVRRAMLHDKRHATPVTGKKLRSMCKKIKSLCFNVTRNGNHVTFSGRGYGHHLGICQWGAREMVRRGYSYQDVLQFYYPNTAFMKLG